MNWQPLLTNRVNVAVLPFSDPASARFQKRFYRARVQ